MINADISALSDQRLFILCKSYGLQTKIWKQKFIGLLPEVNRRRLYEKRGFVSIFDFALKLAAISEMQVRRVINIERSLTGTPVLQQMLIQGEVSMSKLVRVVSVATPQNQQALADQLKILPQRAVETLVRDEKKLIQTDPACISPSQMQNGLHEPQNTPEDVRAHTLQSAQTWQKSPTPPEEVSYKININQDLQLLEKLSPELKEKLRELTNKGIDINNLLLQLIKTREAEIRQEKEQISARLAASPAPIPSIAPIPSVAPPPPPSRHIPVRITRLLAKEHGTKCSVPTCQKPARTLHHTGLFALSKNHDPKLIAPLCYEHHILAHSLNSKFIAKIAGKRL